MYSVLFAGSGGRAEAFERIFTGEGYGTQTRIATTSLTETDLVAVEGSAVVFIDLAVGVAAAGNMLRQLRAYAPVARAPLIALIGEPDQASIDELSLAGADLYIADNPQTLKTRTRFLRSAIERRAQLARALADVRMSEAKYRAVISVLDDGIVVRRKDGSIESLNESVMRMVGIDRSTLTAENWAASPEISMVREDGTPLTKLEQPGFRTLATGEAIHGFVCGLVRPGRDVVWMSLSSSPLRDPDTGELTGSVTSMTDISTRRRAEDEFLALLDRAPDGVMIHRGGKILWTNAALTKLLGYPARSELIGRNMYELLPRRHVPTVEQRMRDRAAGVDVPPLQHSLLRADGTEVEIEIIGMPTIFQGAPALIAYGRDLTEQRRIEAQLIESERLASLGRMAASVGHEINNPLTYLIGNLERLQQALRKTADVDPRLLAMLGDALEGADRVRKIADDLRVSAQRPTTVESSRPLSAGVRPWRILLVDDEPKIAQLLKESLEPHDVTVATDGTTALALLAADPTYDAIVCDLMMPGTSGIDVYERLRAHQPGVEKRIVFMTGGAFTDRSTLFLAAVPNRCLQKPFAIAALLDAIALVTA